MWKMWKIKFSRRLRYRNLSRLLKMARNFTKAEKPQSSVFFIALVFVLFQTSSWAQVSATPLMVDSVQYSFLNTPFAHLKPTIAQMLRVDSLVFFLTAEKGELYVLDLKTGSIKPFIQNELEKEVAPIMLFDVSKSGVYTIQRNMRLITEYDLQGRRINSVKINAMWPKVWLSGRINFAYNERRNSFFLSIEQSSPELKLVKQQEKAKAYFDRQDLIAEVNRKGKIIHSFGFFDQLYQQQFYFHSKTNYFAVDESGQVLYTQHLSHAIFRYDTDNQTTHTLYLPGKFINITQAEVPVTNAPYLNTEDYNSHSIASYQYFHMKLLNATNLCYRIYRQAAVDSTLYRSYETVTIVENSKECVAPTTRKLEQMEILKNKQNYVQLIDYKANKVIYDGPFPFRGKFFLPSKYADPALFYTQEVGPEAFTIYTYKLN